MLHELADTFGCSKQSAWIYADRPDFPKPLDSLKAGKIWKLIEVEAWGKRYLLAMEQKTDAKGKPLVKKNGKPVLVMVDPPRRWRPSDPGGSLKVGRPKGTTKQRRR